MPLSKEDLHKMVDAGPVSDIFKAERAYAVLKAIGVHAESINKAARNLGELFGVLQVHAQTEALVAIARLYDRPSKRHRVLCLEALLNKLQAKPDELPPIIGRANLLREFERQGMPGGTLASLGRASDKDVTLALVAFLRGRLDQPDVKDAVEKLKHIRDKSIAHNEAVAAHSLEGPTWSALLKLLTLAQDTVGLIGLAYLNAFYIHGGEYGLSTDARRPGSAIRRALEGLEIVEPRFNREQRPRRPLIE